MSVWTAPITVGGGTKPAITVKATAQADIGVAVLGVLRALDGGRRRRSSTRDSGVGHDDDRRHGRLRRDRGDDRGRRARPRLLRRLRLRRHADRRGPATPCAATCRRTSRHGPARRGAGAAGGGRDAERHRRHRRQDPVADGAPSCSRPAARRRRRPSPARRRACRATAGDGSASVSWTAPADGGSPITSYTVTPYVGATAQPPTDRHGPARRPHATVTGLTNGTAYTFTVSATNADRHRAGVAPSSAVTPRPPAGGSWSVRCMNWPIVALHSILLHNGKLLRWDGWQQPQPTVVWNPPTRNASHHAQRARQRLLRRRRATCPTVGCWSSAATAGSTHRQPRHRRHQHLRPGDQRRGPGSPTCTSRAGTRP